MSQTIQMPVLALKTAIAGLSKVISKKNTLPVLGAVKITRLAAGQLSLEGTDLDACAIYTTETTKGGKDSTILIPFEELAAVVKGCPKSAFIDLTLEKDTARLRYPVGGTWLEKPITTFSEDEWPVIPRIETSPATLSSEFPKTLITALDCSSDYKPDLTGGWLDVNDPKAHYVVGSDGRQLFTANSFKFDLKESLLIPEHKFLRWSGFHEDGEWSLRLGELNKDGNGWTQIESAYWTLMIKRTQARCPLWKQVIPAETKTVVTFSDEAVAMLLDVLPKLPGASQINAGVTFDVGPMGTIVTGSENGHASSITVDGVKIQGAPNTFTADRTLIAKALKLGLKSLALVDGLTPLVFSDATRKLVIAPLRADPTPRTSVPVPVQPITASTSPEPTTSTDNTQPEGEDVKTVNRITQNETTTTSNGADETEQQQGNSSPLKQAMQKVDQIKDSLRAVQSDLNDLLKLLGQANRDHRSTEKEVEEVRDALQQLQRIKI